MPTSFFTSLSKRLAALGDKSALLLILPAVAALFFIDTPLIKTLVEWTLFGIALSGVTIVISRIAFPQIKLSDLVHAAHEDKNLAAGVVAAAVVLFVGIVFVALVLWAKP